MITALALALHAAALVTPLTKALGKNRPVIVHVWDPKPSELADYAIDDVSEACRKAGATAVLVGPDLVGPISREQEKARGNFPGPVPVITDCALSDMDQSPDEICLGAKNLGASGIGIRYYERDWEGNEAGLETALKTAVGAAEEAGLATLLLAEFGADGEEGARAGVGGLASRVGAAGALAKGDGEEGDDAAPVLGCWDGSEKGLQRLRDAGLGGVVLKNACRGNVGLGAHIKSPSLAAQGVTKLVKAALSKGNKSVWGGAGSTTGGGESGGSMDDYFNQRGPG